MLHLPNAFCIINVGAFSTIQTLNMHDMKCIGLTQHRSEVMRKTTMPGCIFSLKFDSYPFMVETLTQRENHVAIFFFGFLICRM